MEVQMQTLSNKLNQLENHINSRLDKIEDLMRSKK